MMGGVCNIDSGREWEKSMPWRGRLRKGRYRGGAMHQDASLNDTLHADSPHETFERLATLMGSDMGASPCDAAGYFYCESGQEITRR
jgi:hypothetical protein